MKLTRLAAPLAALLLIGAGCGTTVSTSPTDAPRATAPTPQVAMKGNCSNAYYPLNKGTKMSYVSHAGGRDNSYSWEVTDTTDDSATLTYTFSETFQLTSEITCTSEGIRATSFLDMGSAMSGGQVSAKTISSYGQLIPQNLHVGSVWTNGYEVETESTMPAAVKLGMGTSRSTFNTTNTAMGEVTVTVPAGTFTAMKVESKMKLHMVLSPKMPSVDTETTTYSYFVRGKGMVKSETTDSRGGTTNVEATSIETP